MYPPVLKDIQSGAERQLRRFLTACPVTVSRGEWYGGMRLPIHVQFGGLIKAAAQPGDC